MVCFHCLSNDVRGLQVIITCNLCKRTPCFILRVMVLFDWSDSERVDNVLKVVGFSKLKSTMTCTRACARVCARKFVPYLRAYVT